MSFISMFGAIAAGGPMSTIGRDEIAGLIVSTVVTHDMGPETAICDKNGAHPVARYESEAEAEKGHADWCEKARQGLTEIRKLGYGDLIDDRTVILEPEA